MGTLQIILISVFSVALVLSYIGKKRFPDKFNKFIPYNFILLGIMFCYLGQTNDKSFTLRNHCSGTVKEAYWKGWILRSTHLVVHSLALFAKFLVQPKNINSSAPKF